MPRSCKSVANFRCDFRCVFATVGALGLSACAAFGVSMRSHSRCIAKIFASALHHKANSDQRLCNSAVWRCAFWLCDAQSEFKIIRSDLACVGCVRLKGLRLCDLGLWACGALYGGGSSRSLTHTRFGTTKLPHAVHTSPLFWSI